MNKPNSETTTAIERNVMARIKTGQAKMHPRNYYVVLSALAVLVVGLLGFVTAYFMSVVTLWLRIQSAAGPAYGARRNLSNLVGAFPWWALALGIVSLATIIFFVRKVGRLYKLRLVYLIPAVILVSLLLGFAFSYSTLPDMLMSHRPQAVCDSSDVNCINAEGQGYLRGRHMK